MSDATDTRGTGGEGVNVDGSYPLSCLLTLT